MPRENRIKVAILNADVGYSLLLKAVLDSARTLEPAVIHASLVEARSRGASSAPDIVLADLAVSNSSPEALLDSLSALWPNAATVILTERSDEASVLGCLQAGVAGYLLKDTPLPRICEAIQETREGGCPISPRIGRLIARWFHQQRAPAPLAASLSMREREILEALARHPSNKGVASHLGLSEATVRAHLRRIYQKLGVHTRRDAIACLKRMATGPA